MSHATKKTLVEYRELNAASLNFMTMQWFISMLQLWFAYGLHNLYFIEKYAQDSKISTSKQDTKLLPLQVSLFRIVHLLHVGLKKCLITNTGIGS